MCMWKSSLLKAGIIIKLAQPKIVSRIKFCPNPAWQLALAWLIYVGRLDTVITCVSHLCYLVVPVRVPPSPVQPCTSVQLMGFSCKHTKHVHTHTCHFLTWNEKVNAIAIIQETWSNHVTQGNKLQCCQGYFEWWDVRKLGFFLEVYSLLIYGE